MYLSGINGLIIEPKNFANLYSREPIIATTGSEGLFFFLSLLIYITFLELNLMEGDYE